jgi:T-complex protein 1 subunit gamma
MLALIKTSIGTKFSVRWSGMMCRLALEAVRTVKVAHVGEGAPAADGTPGVAGSAPVVDIKRYARVEKIPGGEIEQSVVLRGVMVNKDVTHPAMRRHIANPVIVLLDCPLEYKKGESQTNMEFSKEGDWARAQEIEEEQVKALCERIAAMRTEDGRKVDLVITEKGVSGKCSFF